MKTAKAEQTEHPKKGRWKTRFLKALQEQGAVTTACEMAGVGRTAAYALRGKDAKFAAAWDEAVNVMLDGVEDSALHRARYGWEEPVWYKGEQCGTVRKFSDTLLIFVLRQARPERWARAERLKIEHQGDVVFRITTNVPEPDPEE